MEISLAAEKLFDLGPIEVTNSLFSGVIIVVFISLIAMIARGRLNYANPGRFQLFLEMTIDGFRGISEDILGKANTKKFYTFIVTFFVFIVISNWFGLLPIVGPIVIEHPHHEEHSLDHAEEEHEEDAYHSGNKEEHKAEAKEISVGTCIKERDCVLTERGEIERIEAFPVFRAPTSDVSGTLALSLVAVVFIHSVGFSALGIGYLGKYFNFSNPINAFVGILELISEIGKVISFTFRLFGNIFAGEVLLLVVTSISFGVATLPFLALEVFVGFIQAFVFFMLILVFLSLAVQEHH